MSVMVPIAILCAVGRQQLPLYGSIIDRLIGQHEKALMQVQVAGLMLLFQRDGDHVLQSIDDTAKTGFELRLIFHGKTNILVRAGDTRDQEPRRWIT